MAPNNISTASKDRLLGEYLYTSQGRQKVAQSMGTSLRTQRDYTSVARRAFLVEQLPSGALPIYDKDPDVTAYVVGEEGDSIEARAKSRRVHFPIFEIASVPEVSLSQVQERRYDIIERCQTLAVSEIQGAEDIRAFAIMDAIALLGYDSIPGGENPDIPVVAPINVSVLADAFGQIGRFELNVTNIFINPRDFTDIRKFGEDFFSDEIQRDIVRSGQIGSIWGAKVIQSRKVPEGTCYLTCEPEFFGRIPVRTELTVMAADTPKSRMVGFSCFEMLGIGAYNPRGLTRITISR
jgi:hypothetical protein